MTFSGKKVDFDLFHGINACRLLDQDDLIPSRMHLMTIYLPEYNRYQL